MSEGPFLTVVVPVYNEKDNVEKLLEEINVSLSRYEHSYEVIFVDDGSTDGSFEALKSLRDKHPNVLKIIKFKKNAGQTAAFAAGFEHARGELCATLDADLQNDPADIPKLIETLEKEGVDAVLGVRERRDDSIVRRLSSRLANWYRRKKLGDTASDTGCSLKVFKKHTLKHLAPYKNMHRFFPALLKLHGFTFVEQKVSHRPRHAGVAKYGVGNRLWAGLSDVRAVRWMQKRKLDYDIEEIL